ncbi:MAG: ArsR family transcriptional regulator [Marinibacterium sp.]|nr:ArsR family transcriptional regulator [Marinibacterium sp.]
MQTEPRLDQIGAALADPSRARILCLLMDGRAHTNKELASRSGVTPQTATAHLQKLQANGLTTALRSGRHVYHRIASAEVAGVLETLGQLAPPDHLPDHLTGRAGPAARVQLARSCYNHIAGRLGVQMADRLLDLQVLTLSGDTTRPGPAFATWIAGIGLEFVPKGTGPVAKLCLDWTERREHLSGPLATALMRHALDRGWMARDRDSRALILSDAGRAAFGRAFGLTDADLRAPG